MPLKNSLVRWGAVSQAFHWLMALLIIALGVVGWVMTSMATSPAKIKIYGLHKSIGLTVLALALLRLTWRAIDKRPPDLPMPRWQTVSAHAVHGLLYALMLALPLSGWLFNSAANFPLQWFGFFSVPSLTAGAEPELKTLARDTHYWLFWVLALAFAAHAGAALKHHFVDHDAVWRRMRPWRKRASASTPNVADATSAPQPLPSTPPEV